MLRTVLLSNCVFAAFFLTQCGGEHGACDTRWIRLVFMLSCGKKKRESGDLARNENFTEPLPTDVEGAIRYFRERDPTNPLFDGDGTLLNVILEGEENQIRKVKMKHSRFPGTGGGGGRFVSRHSKKTRDKQFHRESVLMKKILDSSLHENSLGIPGFPDQWDVQELLDQKINGNYRRGIDRLLEECCGTAQRASCNEETFRGACK